MKPPNFIYNRYTKLYSRQWLNQNALSLCIMLLYFTASVILVVVFSLGCHFNAVFLHWIISTLYLSDTISPTEMWNIKICLPLNPKCNIVLQLWSITINHHVLSEVNDRANVVFSSGLYLLVCISGLLFRWDGYYCGLWELLMDTFSDF